MRLDAAQIVDYIRLYKKIGPESFCNLWFGKFAKGKHDGLVEIYVLDISDMFYNLYNKNPSDEIYSELGFAFKRIAHRLYRYLMDKDANRKTKHMKFLRLIEEEIEDQD